MNYTFTHSSISSFIVDGERKREKREAYFFKDIFSQSSQSVSPSTSIRMREQLEIAPNLPYQLTHSEDVERTSETHNSSIDHSFMHDPQSL